METLKTPEVPATFKLTCKHWLTDFRELSSLAWENLPESEVRGIISKMLNLRQGYQSYIITKSCKIPYSSSIIAPSQP